MELSMSDRKMKEIIKKKEEGIWKDNNGRNR